MKDSISVGRTIAASQNEIRLFVEKEAEGRIMVGDLVRMDPAHSRIGDCYGLLASLSTSTSAHLNELARVNFPEEELQMMAYHYGAPVEASVFPVAYRVKGDDDMLYRSAPPILIRSLTHIDMADTGDYKAIVSGGYSYLRRYFSDQTLVAGHVLSLKRTLEDQEILQRLAEYLIALNDPESISLLSLLPGLVLDSKEIDKKNLGQIVMVQDPEITLAVPSEILLSDFMSSGMLLALDEKRSGQVFYGMVSTFNTPPNYSVPNHLSPEEKSLYLSQMDYHAKVTVSRMKSMDGSGSTVAATRVPVLTATPRLATQKDVDAIFGGKKKGSISIGHVIGDGELQVTIPLPIIMQRSISVSGSTGSGKSWTLRVLLSLMLKVVAQKEVDASVVLFDMHNEYAYNASGEEGNTARGLKTLFPNLVKVVGLGNTKKIHGMTTDYNICIPHEVITSADILQVADYMGLSSGARDAIQILVKEYGEIGWFSKLVSFQSTEQIEKKLQNSGVTVTTTTSQGKSKKAKNKYHPSSEEAWCLKHNVHRSTWNHLKKKMELLNNNSYILQNPPATSSIEQIIRDLVKGKSVILSFGRFNKYHHYLLVANILTRLIREKWEEMSSNYLAAKQAGQKAVEPRHLMIAIEEAHKLLKPGLSQNTSFSQIAREMRKTKVTLIVVDQRPSAIDPEVYSQMGTKIIGYTSDADDINVGLSGIPGKDRLRHVPASLKPGKEMLLAGAMIPMTIRLNTRRYDDELYKEIEDALKSTGVDTKDQSAEDALDDLGL